MSLLYWTFVAGLILLIPAGYAGKIGAPWVPVRKRAITRTFDELEIGEGDVVVDVGCGDGKVLLEAARRGARAVGFELSPYMWFIAWLRTLGNKRIQVRYGNFFKMKLPSDTTVVYSFLMPETMSRLDAHLKRQELPHAKYLASYMFGLKEGAPLVIFREKNCGPVYVYDIAEKP